MSKILIITPVNVLYNWKAEFDKWVEDRDYTLHILESKDLLKTRIRTMEFWDEDGGILLSGYDMFRNFCVGKKIKSKKKKDKIFEILVDPGAQFVICDEGHVMRNSKSGLSKCLNLIGTRRRIVLTGTPLQNNLQEYYCMTNFIKPNLLGSQTEFTNRFANPITNGQHADSTMSDVRVMKQRAAYPTREAERLCTATGPPVLCSSQPLSVSSSACVSWGQVPLSSSSVCARSRCLRLHC